MGANSSCSGSTGDISDSKHSKVSRNKNHKIKRKARDDVVNECDEDQSTVNIVKSSSAIGVMVKVHVYNLRQGSNHLNSSLGFGIFHSGVEVFDREWSFGGNVNAKRGDSGIFYMPPGMVLPRSSVYEIRELGRLPPEATQEIIEMAVRQNMLRYWTAESYHLVNHNCNHFSENFVDLLNRTFNTTLVFPSYINRAAKFLDTFIPGSVIERVVGITPNALIADSPKVSTKVCEDIKLHTHTKDGIPLGDFVGFSLEQMKHSQQRTACNRESDVECSNPMCPRCRMRYDAEDPVAVKSPDQEDAIKFVIPETRDDMRKLGLKQLKTIMWVNGIDWTGCLEKEDILDAIENFKKQSGTI
eukprot:Tbor_TRINITY_DN3411_c0_g1::TRINITY_DN3411_c0_g1_i2::g.3681::m.3681